MKRFILPIITILLGFATTIIGSLFKIQHWPYGSVILTIGMLLQVLAIIIAIVVIIKIYREKS